MGLLLVTGASGLLGWNLARAARARGMDVAGSARGGPPPGLEGIHWHPCDLAVPGEPWRLLREARPTALVHAAAIAHVAACERKPSAAWETNAGAVAEIARGALEAGLRWLQVSTDLVFDGKAAPYRPGDPPRPLSIYGRTKALAERAALASGGDVLVARVPLLYGRSPGGDRSASERLLAAARRGEEIVLYRDEWRSPLDAGEAADALLDLLGAPARGVLHLAGPERLSRLDFGREVLRAAGLLATARVREASRLEHRGPARPEDLALDGAEAARLLRSPLSPPRIALAARGV